MGGLRESRLISRRVLRKTGQVPSLRVRLPRVAQTLLFISATHCVALQPFPTKSGPSDSPESDFYCSEPCRSLPVIVPSQSVISHLASCVQVSAALRAWPFADGAPVEVGLPEAL